MKKEIRYVLFGCILAIIAFFVVVVRLRTDAETDAEHIYWAHKSELENAVQEIIDTGKTDGIIIPGVKTDIVYSKL